MNNIITPTFKQLNAWKQAHQLVLQTYKLTNKFPSHEVFSLTNQIRRAAIFITSNIAEGSTKPSIKDKLNFLYIALGSLRELDSQFLIAKDLSYISISQYEQLLIQINTVGKLIYGLIKKYKPTNK